MDGSYTLLVDLASSTTVTIGALGKHRLRAGRYAYTGSAFGPGGLTRVNRHRELARGERDTHHWHVDYLLGAARASVAAVVISEGVDIECAVAGALDDRFERVERFGASDCDCPSHLHHAPPGDAEALAAAAERAHETARKRE